MPEPGPNSASNVRVIRLQWSSYARCGCTMGVSIVFHLGLAMRVLRVDDEPLIRSTSSNCPSDGGFNGVDEVSARPGGRAAPRGAARATARVSRLPHSSSHRGPEAAPRFIIGEREHRLYLLCPQHIERIESYGNYVRLYCAADRYLRRDSLKHLETSLAPLGFIRIRHSLLLNLGVVHYIEKLGCGVMSFSLPDGRCFKSSATYRSHIAAALQLGFPIDMPGQPASLHLGMDGAEP